MVPTPAEDHLVHLMVEYQGGRLDAFEELYAVLAGELRGYLTTASRDATAAADLVQETFLAMHRSRRTYRPPLPVRPWLYGIARHVLARHRRAAASAGRDAREGQPAPPPRSPLDGHDVEDALARLPAARREAWLLHHVHGFSFDEIAARLRIGVDAAKLRSSRATRALRALLGIEGRSGRG